MLPTVAKYLTRPCENQYLSLTLLTEAVHLLDILFRSSQNISKGLAKCSQHFSRLYRRGYAAPALLTPLFSRTYYTKTKNLLDFSSLRTRVSGATSAGSSGVAIQGVVTKRAYHCVYCVVTNATVLWIAAAPPCANRFRWHLAMTSKKQTQLKIGLWQKCKTQRNTAARFFKVGRNLEKVSSF